MPVSGDVIGPQNGSDKLPFHVLRSLLITLNKIFRVLVNIFISISFFCFPNEFCSGLAALTGTHTQDWKDTRKVTN